MALKTITKEEDFFEESWDPKKLLALSILSVIVVVLLYSNRDMFLSRLPKLQHSKVAGASTQVRQKALSLPSQSDFKKQFDSIKAEVMGLDIQEVASSSPQVQKLINDIKGFKDLPKNQAKQFCEQVCSGL